MRFYYSLERGFVWTINANGNDKIQAIILLKAG